MFTRKQYLDDTSGISHQDYYGQFVSEYVKSTLYKYIGLNAILSSKDKHFNDIALRKWDNLPVLGEWLPKLKEAGDCVSLSATVCIYKEAARQIMELEG